MLFPLAKIVKWKTPYIKKKCFLNKEKITSKIVKKILFFCNYLLTE